MVGGLFSLSCNFLNIKIKLSLKFLNKIPADKRGEFTNKNHLGEAVKMVLITVILFKA